MAIVNNCIFDFTDAVWITIHSNITTEDVTDKVTDNQRKIIECIIRNNKITTNQLSNNVGISQRKIKENIQKLKDKNILYRIGPAKGGHWQLAASYTE